MAMNKQRKSSNLLNILNYDDAGNIVLRDYSQTIRYNWNGTIHAFTGPLSISSVAAAVTDTDRFLVSDGGVLKYRTGAEVLSDIGAIGGSGASGQVAYWNGTSSQTGSNNLFWDAANSRLGIGTTSPQSILQVGSYTASGAYAYGTAATFANSWNANRTTIVLISNTNTLTQNKGGGIGFAGGSESAASPYTFAQIKGLKQSSGADYSGYLAFYTTGSDSNAEAEKMRITSVGNLLLQNGGTFTDSGQRLQVQGDAFIKGSGATSATNSLTVQNSDGNNILRLRNDLAALFNFVGTSLTMSGEANYTIMLANQAFYFRSNGGTAGRAFKIFDNASSLTGTSGANQNIQSLITFAPTSGTATYTDLDLSSTINQTGGANGITRGLYVRPTLTAAADWRSIEWSNNSGWGLYGAGTANNYLAGKLVIGTTTVSTFALDVNGTARVSGAFGVNGFDSLYNQKLYVNGNIRIQDGNGVGDTDSNTGEWIKFSSINGVTLGTGGAERLRITSGGNLLVGTTADQGYRVQITSASADSQLNVWGATAPSIRLDNAASGATQRFVIGLATATNNFIQGANAGDVCMTPGTSSALVFGMWQTSSSSEVMRISTSSNVLIGTSTDVGAKLRVVGDISASVDLRLTRTGTSPAIILDQTQLRLVNQTSGFGIGLNVEQDIIRFGGAIRTNPPAGSGNPEYKLGSYSATAPTATGYLNIEVGGVVYKVLAST